MQYPRTWRYDGELTRTPSGSRADRFSGIDHFQCCASDLIRNCRTYCATCYDQTFGIRRRRFVAWTIAMHRSRFARNARCLSTARGASAARTWDCSSARAASLRTMGRSTVSEICPDVASGAARADPLSALPGRRGADRPHRQAPARASLTYRIDDANVGARSHVEDGVVAALCAAGRQELLGKGWDPLAASLEHAAPDDTTPFAAFFGCPVAFSADATRLRCARVTSLAASGATTPIFTTTCRGSLRRLRCSARIAGGVMSAAIGHPTCCLRVEQVG